jgi:hypothetical protein
MSQERLSSWRRTAQRLIETQKNMTRPQQVSIAVDQKRRVSGLLQVPSAARACYVFAHGAGAGMSHPFMTGVADGLAERGIATLRYQFPYMEEGNKRPDVPKVAQAAVRAAVDEALQFLPRAFCYRRRKVVWRPHDLASASRITVARSARPGVPRLPAAPWAAIGRAWSPSI